MASVSGEKYCDSAVNVPAYVGISSFSAKRKSATSTTVTLKFKVYVYTSSSGSYSYNSLCVWVDDGSKRTVFNSNSGSVHTTKGKKYYTSEITLTKTVKLGSTTTSFTVGVNGTAWNPSSPKKTFTFKVSGIPKGSYTIQYNANGGSDEPSSQTKWYDTTLKLSSVKPTRYGYTFDGWGTSTTDTTVDYNAGGSYTSNSSDTLYAIWSKSIALSYNANSGSGAPSSQSTTIYNATTSNTFTISSTTPTRVGYDFLGWSLDSTATSASYQPSASITLSDSDILYAIWRLKTYTISYNANGGINPPSSQIKTYGVNLTLTLTEPTRSGYKFLGWSTNSSSEEPTYLSGDTFVTNENTILYAIWEQLGIAYINIDGTFQAGKIWVNDYGTWMTGIIFVNDNGTWTQGGI